MPYNLTTHSRYMGCTILRYPARVMRHSDAPAARYVIETPHGRRVPAAHTLAGARAFIRGNIRDLRNATYGIRVGGTITTRDGSGEVTRVGSIAGFYLLNGTETRWEEWEVIR